MTKKKKPVCFADGSTVSRSFKCFLKNTNSTVNIKLMHSES